MKDGEEEEEEEDNQGRGAAVRIEQVCRGEIRELQVSLQDCYIDLRGSKTKRCAESFITASRRVNMVSNTACALYYEAIIPNTCPHTHRRATFWSIMRCFAFTLRLLSTHKSVHSSPLAK